MTALRARLVALLAGSLLALLAHLGVAATPELHAALEGLSEAVLGVMFVLGPMVYQEIQKRRAAQKARAEGKVAQ